MCETGEKCFMVNSCIFYARQTRKIYQVLLYPVDLKTLGELWVQLTRATIMKCSFFGIKDL